MKKLLYTSFIALLVLVTLSNCKKEVVEISNIEEFTQYLEDEMDFQKIPAMSVLLFSKEEILYQNLLGKTHLQQNISLKNDHPFLLASISKVITAIALLQLHEEGKFLLDDKINDHLPFSVSIPNHSQDITFRMLLTHTSGIDDGSELDNQYYYGIDSPISLSSFLQDYLVPSGRYYDANDNFHDFAPGTNYEYSNVGNALIGLLVQEISGVDFNAYCKQNIFSPLGMTNSFWRLDEISKPIVQPYNYRLGRYEAIGHYTFTDYPNGGLRSTSLDLHKLIQALLNGGSSNNHQLLSSSVINQMLTKQIPSLNNEIGLHLFELDAENGLWGHDGGEQGVSTVMAFNRSTKVGAIILSNQGDADLDEMLIEAYKLGLKLK